MPSTKLVRVVLVLAAIVLAFVVGSRVQTRASAAVTNFVVLCPSCSVPGSPSGLWLLDTNTGDIWIYSDAVLAGQGRPVNWGQLRLGQPVVRTGR